MKITTLRLPEGLAEDLENEAEEADLSFSEYARRILRNRNRIRQENTQENTDEYASRIRDLEKRVERLETSRETGNSAREPWGSNVEEGDRDIVAWVREHQPVSRSDIVDAFESEWQSRGIKGDSWWRRDARPQLEDAGFEYVRNVGWKLPD